MTPTFPRASLLALLTVWLMACAGLAQAQAIPALTARVTDNAHLLSESERDKLTQASAELETRKGSQIAILTVDSTGDDSIEDYAVRVFESWKLGRKDVDDGILIVVAAADHRMRIEVGNGLEGAVPDAIASRIIREQMAPRFKQDDYYEGLSAAMTSLVHAIDGEPLPAPAGVTSHTIAMPASAFAILAAVTFLCGLAAGSGKVGWRVWAGVAALPAVVLAIFTHGAPLWIALPLEAASAFFVVAGYGLYVSSLLRKIVAILVVLAGVLIAIAQYFGGDVLAIGLGSIAGTALGVGYLALMYYWIRKSWKASPLLVFVRLAVVAAIAIAVGVSNDEWMAGALAGVIAMLFAFAQGVSGGSRSGGGSSGSGGSSSSGGFSGGGGSSSGGGSSGSW